MTHQICSIGATGFRVICGSFSSRCFWSLERERVFAEGTRVPEGVSAVSLEYQRQR